MLHVVCFTSSARCRPQQWRRSVGLSRRESSECPRRVRTYEGTVCGGDCCDSACATREAAACALLCTHFRPPCPPCTMLCSPGSESAPRVPVFCMCTPRAHPSSTRRVRSASAAVHRRPSPVDGDARGTADGLRIESNRIGPSPLRGLTASDSNCGAWVDPHPIAREAPQRPVWVAVLGAAACLQQRSAGLCDD